MEDTIIIKNPLIFLNESYFKKHIFKDTFKDGTVNVILKNEIPYEIFITFKDDPSLCDKFIEKYNNNFFEDEFNYKLQIEKAPKDLDIEKEKESIISQEEKYIKIPYHIDYENMIFKDYENSLYKNGLIYHDEEEKSKIANGAKWLIKKFGQNLLQGKSVLRISLPVFLFDKRTLQEVFAYELKGAPYYLHHAYYSKNIFERLKWITVLMMSQCYISTFETKPFNPIIGETFQCRIGDLQIYLEQTENHPITSNFYGITDNKHIKIYGYIIYDASIGVNNCYAVRLGKFFIEFDDGQKYQIRTPAVLLQGFFNERLYNYVDSCIVLDLTNNYASFIKMNPDEVSYVKSFFTNKQNTPPDTFIGQFCKLSDVTVRENDGKHELNKNSTPIIKIEGSWTRDISFDGEEYWNVEDNKLFTIYETGYILPSDGRKREDYIELVKGNIDKAQEEKERLENLQRYDRKLRADYAKKNKK